MRTPPKHDVHQSLLEALGIDSSRYESAVVYIEPDRYVTVEATMRVHGPDGYPVFANGAFVHKDHIYEVREVTTPQQEEEHEERSSSTEDA